jgi:outer membrane immunogenic protein
MKKCFAVAGLAVSAITLATLNARAADMPVKAQIAPPAPIATVYNWSGFYIGANGGGVWGRANVDDYNGLLFPPFVTTAPGIPILVILGQNGTLAGASATKTSWLAGGQVGYNWHVNQFLIGIEGDADATGLRASGIASATRFAGTPTVQTVSAAFSADTHWMASLRLRAGVTFDRVLLYVTGGGTAAGLNVNTAVTVVNGPGITVPAGAFAAGGAASSSTRLGWTIGGGIEWAFDHAWSVAAEYRHSDFGRVSAGFIIPDGLGGALATGASNVRLTTDQATLRLNYRFGAPGPVVARY